MDVGDLVDVSGKAEEEAGAARLVLIQRMLGLTPEQRLRGLANAAAFFADARRVDTGAEGRDVEMKEGHGSRP